jgi:hypothetical protein
MRVGERQHAFGGVHAQRRVLDQRVEEVRRHALVDVPVARFVHEAREPEIVIRAGAFSAFAPACARASGASEACAAGEDEAEEFGAGHGFSRRTEHRALPRKEGPEDHTASDSDENVKSRIFIGGIIITNDDSSPARAPACRSPRCC